MLGLNLDKYDNKLVKSLTLVDISDGMISEAAERVQVLSNLNGIEVKFIKADATSELVNLFGEEKFDTVVDSFSLCVMGNIGALKCLDQIKRVVKKGNLGQILLLENSRSSNQLLGLYQDATANAAASAGGKGCVYNQNVESLILQTGGLNIQDQLSYSAGLFRFFKCIRT
jgi:ubiquinone/menaquinone biosynthesis C-methylase UbiE